MKKTVTDIRLYPQNLYYSNIEVVSHDFHWVTFKPYNTIPSEERIIEHAGPYTIVRTTTMSCGHDLTSYYEEDGGNAGMFPGCKKCDEAVEAAHNEQNANVL